MRRIFTQREAIATPAIVALLNALPIPGTTWPRVQKERWMKAFVACLELSYPDELPASGEASADEQASRIE